MSFYRSLLVAVAALAFTVPAFADDATPAQAADTTTTTTTQTATDAAQPAAKVDINKASVKDLAKIKGLSAAKAKAIVAYRKKNGEFKSLDELKSVKGFKKLNNDQLKEIQDQLTAG